MKVVELWRYPVKSLQGEQLDQVEVGPDGLDGDRRFALYDRESGLGLTARRVPELLFASASLRQDGEVNITLPDGSVTRDDDVLSAWLDRPVTLRSAREDVARSFENVVDFEREPTSEWKTFSGAPGPFHDGDPRARTDHRDLRQAGDDRLGQRHGADQQRRAALGADQGIAWHYIAPGKPMQNAFVESFNGRLRDECLNEHVFTTLAEARRIIEAWRIDYNTVRPHGRLGRLPPAVFGATRRRPEEQRGGTLRSIGGFAPRPVAPSQRESKSRTAQSADV